jgi:hypothetical protein
MNLHMPMLRLEKASKESVQKSWRRCHVENGHQNNIFEAVHGDGEWRQCGWMSLKTVRSRHRRRYLLQKQVQFLLRKQLYKATDSMKGKLSERHRNAITMAEGLAVFGESW